MPYLDPGQTDRGRPRLAAVQNTIQQLSSACRLIYGAPTGEVGTTFQSRPRPGEGQKWITPL